MSWRPLAHSGALGHTSFKSSSSSFLLFAIYMPMKLAEYILLIVLSTPAEVTVAEVIHLLLTSPTILAHSPVAFLAFVFIFVFHYFLKDLYGLCHTRYER